MRIVYLDEPTYLPEWWRARFATLGEFEVFIDRPDPETALRRLCGADLAVVEWTRLAAGLLSRITRLRYLTLVTTSFDTVDLDAAARAGLTVAHCSTYSRQAVAEHVFASLLALIRRLPAADRAVRAGASHLYGPFLGLELHGRTLGLLGTGRIATAVARIAAGFGMEVIGANRTGRAAPGITVLPLHEVLRRSDVLSLHVPLDGTTRGLLTAERLGTLKPSAVLVNTSRGALLDQAALTRMLTTGRLAGAALDDITTQDAELLRTLDNVILTPGTAWYTDTARSANLQEVYDNLTSYLAGHPRNVLTGPGRR
ncbi:NAD(P)-dependent oxidoreductase [Streptomyces sp. NPDC046931]|uniref:2-hydroxyacid dehydrogenase n=1 Tax=Streptomyces sp. NPDC046931 TaxID=3154806 RepID=UPI00341147EC